jgi:arabinogalactan oligomer/maltooligosaccharide transport system substrate-binding protein
MDVPNGWYANSFIMSPQACGVNSLYWSTNTDGQKVYTSTWDSEIGVKVSEYIAGLLTPYYADGTLKIGSNEVIQAGFADRSLIAAVSGTWMENLLAAEIGADLAADKLPEYHIDGQAYQMASFGGSKVYCINKTRPVEEQRTAAALAELLTGKDAQLVRFEKRASLPCNKEAAADPRYTENVSIGGAAFVKQAAFACVQSQTAEDRYWDIGKAIGQAYIDSNLNGETWAQFLKGQMDTLRKTQI